MLENLYQKNTHEEVVEALVDLCLEWDQTKLLVDISMIKHSEQILSVVFSMSKQ